MCVLPEPVGPEQQDVRLLDQALARRGRLAAPFEVVVGGDGDRALGAVLADDVAIEIVEDLARRQRLAPVGDAGIRPSCAREYPTAFGELRQSGATAENSQAMLAGMSGRLERYFED